MSDTTMSDTRENEDAGAEVAAEGKQRAGTERLLALMAAHGRGPWVASFGEEMGGEGARAQFVTALVGAAVYCARPSLRRAGLGWEEVQAALQAGPATERALHAARRIGRAARLLKRLALRGEGAAR